MGFVEHYDGRRRPPKDIPGKSLFEDLPTTEEIVLTGLSQILSIKNRIKQMESAGSIAQGASAIFGGDRQLHACFLGLTPEVGSFHPTDTMRMDSFPQVLEVIQEESLNILVVNHLPASWNERPLGLVNLEAAKVVVERAPEIFPERAKTDLRAWLGEESEQWFPSAVNQSGECDFSDTEKDIIHTRMGLLSGFPLNASLNFAPFQRATDKLDLNDDMDELTDTEKELVRKIRIVECLKGGLSFNAFSQEDFEYGSRLDQVADGAEASIVATELMKSLMPILSKIPPWFLEKWEKAGQKDPDASD